MSHKLKRIWILPAVIAMSFLLLSLPVLAQPAPRPLADAWMKVTVLSDSVLARVGNLFMGLWLQGAVKEGMSIDPNGSPKPQTPSSGTTDEGVTIDPNGHP
jgi:hypothetical protein